MPKDASLQKESEWEEMFDVFLDTANTSANKKGFRLTLVERNALKFFISQVISNREKEIAEEVEKIKFNMKKVTTNVLIAEGKELESHNKAIDKVLSILKH